MSSKRPTIVKSSHTEFLPIKKSPEKTPDPYFTSPKSYLLLSIPKTPKFDKIESKLELIHKNSIKTRQSELRIRNLSSSNVYLEKVRDWGKEKSARQEELVMRMNLIKKNEDYSPGKKQIFDVDEEDFNYSYLNKIGSIRKVKKNMLDVAVKPNYLAPELYISMQPYSFYSTPKAVRRNFEYEYTDESFKVKRALAAREIKCKLHKINGSLIPNDNKELPRGGELLMRLK